MGDRYKRSPIIYIIMIWVIVIIINMIIWVILINYIIISNITDKTETIAKSINRIKNKGTHGFLKKCVELYDKQFYEGFNFNQISGYKNGYGW